MLPVIGESLGGQGEYLGGKVLRCDPRQDEEAGIVDDEMEVALALRVSPADEVVAGRTLPGAGAEAEQGEDFLVDADQVAQLCAGQGLVAEAVVAVDVFIPQLRIGAPVNGLKR